MLLRWQTEDLYGKIRAARTGRPMYVLHDGPPYANGNIHLGTALNKILKDFIVKLKTMEGYDSPYIPGWDCHGLPIENKVDNELGPKKAQMTAAQIRGLPQVRREVRRSPARRLRPPRHPGPLAGPLSHDERRIRIRDRGHVRRSPGSRLRV